MPCAISASSQESEIWINGGYFIFRKEIFDYIQEGEELVVEPFNRLIEEGQLMAYKYEGFWRAMDTLRDRQVLEEMVERGETPWRSAQQLPPIKVKLIMKALQLAERWRAVVGAVPGRAFGRHRNRRRCHAAEPARAGRSRSTFIGACSAAPANVNGRRGRRRQIFLQGAATGSRSRSWLFGTGFSRSRAKRSRSWFEVLKARVNPDVILTHRRDDAHQDHRQVCRLTWNTFRDHCILEYEIPKWDGDLGPAEFLHACFRGYPAAQDRIA